VKKLSLLLLAALALGSCKKNDDNSPSSPSKTDLLTTKSWQPVTFTASSTAGGITSSIGGNVDACNTDDILKFGTDKSLLYDQGATKCDPNDPQTEKGTWDMPGDSKLTINSLTSTNLPDGTFDIKELTATTLHLNLSETSNGATTTYDMTLKAR
jgi:hypothetical protein